MKKIVLAMLLVSAVTAVAQTAAPAQTPAPTAAPAAPAQKKRSKIRRNTTPTWAQSSKRIQRLKSADWKRF